MSAADSKSLVVFDAEHGVKSSSECNNLNEITSPQFQHSRPLTKSEFAKLYMPTYEFVHKLERKGMARRTRSCKLCRSTFQHRNFGNKKKGFQLKYVQEESWQYIRCVKDHKIPEIQIMESNISKTHQCPFCASSIGEHRGDFVNLHEPTYHRCCSEEDFDQKFDHFSECTVYRHYLNERYALYQREKAPLFRLLDLFELHTLGNLGATRQGRNSDEIVDC